MDYGFVFGANLIYYVSTEGDPQFCEQTVLKMQTWGSKIPKILLCYKWMSPFHSVSSQHLN